LIYKGFYLVLDFVVKTSYSIYIIKRKRENYGKS